MGLRVKIISGFLVLALMLILAGAWSIYELRNIAESVPKILEDNYKSIRAAKVMIESLEREDSAVLLLLSGKWEEGRNVIQEADQQFLQAFNLAVNNITMPGEDEVIEKIKAEYETYKTLWERPIVGTKHEGNLKWYLETVFRSFLQVKASVNNLSDMNDRGMYEAALYLRDKAHRSTMPGVVAMISALVLSLMFSYFVNYFMISPIIKITESVKSFMNAGTPFKVRIETTDEIKELESSIMELTAKVSTKEKKP